MLQVKNLFVLIFTVLLIAACNKTNNNSTTNDQHISVLTQHNNNTRSGWNNNETKLTTSNVNAKTFGKLFALSVDDQVYSQPLVVGNVPITGGTHNVVYIATVNNSVYAFNADDGTQYWQKSFTASGMRPPKNTDMTGACGGGYQDFSGNIGIVGTPVIDSTLQTMYFVARSTDGKTFVEHLHAINIVTGNENTGSPVKITATYKGTGGGNVNGTITFNPQTANQRSALTLVNGTVYVTFSSHCDWGPYHGWILGYDVSTLVQKIVYNDTPNGEAGGIWQSGGGIAADAQGNLYFVIGNGTVGVGTDAANVLNRGESAMKLTPSGSTLTVSSFFTPYNYQVLEADDLDYGTLGAFLIPNTNLFFTGCKDGNLYIINKDIMGGVSATKNNIAQTIFTITDANMHCQPTYYKGTTKEFAYIWAENDKLRAIPFNRTTNLFDDTKQVFGTTSGPTGQNGAVLSVSSNGALDGTGILWASYAASGDAEHTVSPGILRAFNANDITKELWNNNAQTAADRSGNYAKFAAPTIANGKVYLPTFSNQVGVYGLK